MKKVIVAILMVSSIQAFAKADHHDHGKMENHKSHVKTLDKSTKSEDKVYSKVAKVHGMVCAFCSNSLEKKFKKKKAVKNINVDLERKTVSIEFKKGKTISDKKLKKMITSSGFKVVSIENYKTSSPGKNLDKK